MTSYRLELKGNIEAVFNISKTEKRYFQKKNAILPYFERPFK